MLKIEDNEMQKITEFLSLLQIEFAAIDYVKKGDIFYNAKTKAPIHDLLSYILLNYPSLSDIHFSFYSSQSIDINVRQHGTLLNSSIKMDESDNYTTAKINNLSFSTDIFKKHLDILRGINADNTINDFVDEVSIPPFGEYRIRSSIMGKDAIFRFIKNTKNKTINCNILEVNSNPVYNIKAEFKSGILINSPYFHFTDEIKTKLNLYERNFIKMFNEFNEFKGLVNIYKGNKVKIKLEYVGNNEIKIEATGNYSISREHMNSTILNYVLKNYHDFYDPIFTNFIEDVTQHKIDTIMGEFKSPEALKDYLTVIKMLKI